MRLAARQRELEADLVTGVLALDDYARAGVPVAVQGLDPPDSYSAEVLGRVFDAVQASDLRYVDGVWRWLQHLHRKGEPFSEAQIPAWITTYGLGVGFAVPQVARKLLGACEARRRRDAFLAAAADCEGEVGLILA